ncbi:hypothetical protein GCM10009850_109860 [Nonomuraea monospora]|uniref:Uncharacterized protein n=1 Tax=Nonomuraea monospora TaxID=568818 RepID=A0ABN3D143_9ACTN
MSKGKHEDPNSPKVKPFEPDPAAITPDGNKESTGEHGKKNGGKK